MTGIYKITNKINGKCYIGQSIDIETRLKQHQKKIGSEENPMYVDFKTYGLENFSFEVLQECDRQYLNDREAYWSEYYNSFNEGYNLTKGGGGKFGHDRFISTTESNISNLVITFLNGLLDEKIEKLDKKGISIENKDSYQKRIVYLKEKYQENKDKQEYIKQLIYLIDNMERQLSKMYTIEDFF